MGVRRLMHPVRLGLRRSVFTISPWSRASTCRWPPEAPVLMVVLSRCRTLLTCPARLETPPVIVRVLVRVGAAWSIKCLVERTVSEINRSCPQLCASLRATRCRLILRFMDVPVYLLVALTVLMHAVLFAAAP